MLFDDSDQVFLTSERKYLRAANLFDSYDNKKYCKCKIVVRVQDRSGLVFDKTKHSYLFTNKMNIT